MADFGLKIDGLAELREALKQLPADLLNEASVVVHAQAQATHAIISARYPVVTGNLKQHLKIELGRDAVSVSARVKNTAKHAWIFENGTAARRKGNGASTGRMPAHHLFVSTAMARRRLMYAALVDIVRRAGLTVTGNL